jgi:hypothetical protein
VRERLMLTFPGVLRLSGGAGTVSVRGMRALVTAALALAAVAGGALPASAARVYAGDPVDGRLQLVLELSDDGTALERVSFLLHGWCNRTDSMLHAGTTTGVAQLPDRPAPGATLLLTPSPVAGGGLEARLLSSRASGPDRVDVARGTLTGRLTATRGSGTLRVRRTVAERATGRVLRSCARTLRWRAVRDPGRVFGGSTSAGAPVVLRMSRDHRRVTRTIVSWAARCRRASFYVEPHDWWLLPFGLTAAGRFDERYRYDAGRGGRVIGRFAGRVGTTTASGRFTSRFQSRRDRCPLAPQTWTARTG